MPQIEVTALQQGLVSCHSCHLLCQKQAQLTGQHQLCPRCGAALHSRKENSLSRCWALLLAACVMLLPANLLPITLTSALGTTHADTIMSGVIYFIKSGSYEIALVIFTASIFVPFLKVLILLFLLLSVHFRWRWSPRDRTRLYRLTEIIGRWSMIDVYVVTILVALVKLGAVATIDAGPGAIYFAGVVILTMLAAQSFDPRLIWDAMEETDE